MSAFGEAKSALLQAEKLFGPNIAILRDLACLHYQTGEMGQWRRSYRELAERLSQLRPKLSAKVVIQCAVVLGKFMEEEGLIHEALQNFESGYQLAQSHSMRNMVHLCLPQILRLRALYGFRENLAQYYRDLLLVAHDGETFDLRVEMEHSLMLAEFVLVGPEHAWARFIQLNATPGLSDLDSNLFLFDFVAESLALGLKAPPDFAAFIRREFDDLDAYERELLHLVEPGDNLQSVALLRLSRLASQTSWSNYLRILILYRKTLAGTSTALEIQHKIELLLGSLPPDSRQHWMRLIKVHPEVNNASLQFDRKAGEIRFHGKAFNLSRRRYMAELVHSLSETREIDVDRLISRLWNSTYSPEHFQRLRMTVHRLNQVLFELSAIPKAVHITADKVFLEPSVRLECQ